ncbi:MAG TPA: endonuclease/exonuclease/phosphatase family protein [Methylomirabilota bacterium]|nr:endonuclease/exonuclease/phosphatase family protein [Methylomirabilota bacterium]
MFTRFNRTICALYLLAAALGTLTCNFMARAQSAEPIALRVATFNLRFASDKKPNSWAERRPVVRACIEEMAPDVMGTQGGVYPQLKDVAADLPDYEWIGLGRDGGSRGEFMAIFYRKARFEPLEYDHFWLSDTPNVIASTNWGNTNRRMTTWVRFRERASGRGFYVFNTHLDHALRSAREKGALLIRQRVQEVATNNLPVLLIGDFNAEPGKEKTYDMFLEGDFFADTWRTARTRRNDDLDTFHNFRGAKKGTFRIDWILTRGSWECDANEVVVFSRDNQFPSDHHPVLARLRLR